MNLKTASVAILGSTAASATFAGGSPPVALGAPMGVSMGTTVGTALGDALGAVLSPDFWLGNAPLLGVTAVSLVLAIAIARRKLRR